MLISIVWPIVAVMHEQLCRAQNSAVGCLRKNTTGVCDEIDAEFCINLDNNIDKEFYCFVKLQY